jgi:hypothetical protein
LWILIAAILLLSLFLRLYHLGSRPLYGDEANNTVEVSNQSLSYVLTTNYGSNLYPLILHFLLPLGNTEVMSRLPAAIFGLLSVWGIFIVGRRILGQREAVLAAFLGAVSTPFLYFSQQARAYTGLLFFSLLTLYLFWRALAEEKKSLWILYALFMIIGAYAHFFLLVTLPIHGLFILVMAVEKRISKKTLLLFFLAGALVVSLTVLIYWPTKNAPTDANIAPNFIYLMKNALASLFHTGRNINAFSLFREIVQRQFDYSTRPLLFFVNFGLLILGWIFCLKRQRREGLFLLSYLILPFFLFVLSNPPSVYCLGQDNKFIFILPVIYLFTAKGLTGIYEAMASRLGKFGPTTIAKALRTACAGLLMVGMMFVGGVYLRDYSFSFWKLRSLRREPAIDTQLRQQVVGLDMILSDDYLNKSEVLLVRPVSGVKRAKKIVMIFEAGGVTGPVTCDFLKSPDPGLWVLVRRKVLEEKQTSDLQASLPEVEIKEFSRHFLLHFPAGKTLQEKLAVALNLLMVVQGRQERKSEYHLLSAKLDLCAGRIPDGLQQIAAAGRFESQPGAMERVQAGNESSDQWTDKRSFLKSTTAHDFVCGELSRQLVDLLMERAEQSIGRGNIKEAFVLLSTARNLDPASCESSTWFHLLLAESYIKEGSKAEALQEYKKALCLCRDEPRIDSVIKKMRSDLSLPSGFVLWQEKDIYHLRWWSEQKSTFSGSLESSLPIKKVTEVQLAPKGRYHCLPRSLVFEAASANGRIVGLTMKTRPGSRLEISLKINGRKETGERAIYFLDYVRPKAKS